MKLFLSNQLRLIKNILRILLFKKNYKGKNKERK